MHGFQYYLYINNWLAIYIYIVRHICNHQPSCFPSSHHFLTRLEWSRRFSRSFKVMSWRCIVHSWVLSSVLFSCEGFLSYGGTPSHHSCFNLIRHGHPWRLDSWGVAPWRNGNWMMGAASLNPSWLSAMLMWAAALWPRVLTQSFPFFLFNCCGDYRMVE